MAAWHFSGGSRGGAHGAPSPHRPPRRTSDTLSHLDIYSGHPPAAGNYTEYNVLN